MQELAHANLVRIRELLHAYPLKDSRLQKLWGLASKSPIILRHSRHRTVLKVKFEQQTWVLKIYHPQRKFELLRRLVSKAPARRELSAAAGLNFSKACAEQVCAGLGVFARPWLEDVGYLPSVQDWGRALAKLHLLGWYDRDLSPLDFVWNTDGLAIPIDLGSAEVKSGQNTSRRRQWLNLRRFLAEMDADWVAQNCQDLLLEHERVISELGKLPKWSWKSWAPPFAEERLTYSAKKLRRRRLHKRSFRSLRECSDFTEIPNGVLRRGFSPPAGQLEIISQWEGGLSTKCGAVWQLQIVGNDLTAKELHRQLYLRELTNSASFKSLGYCASLVWIEGVPRKVNRLTDLLPE